MSDLEDVIFNAIDDLRAANAALRRVLMLAESMDRDLRFSVSAAQLRDAAEIRAGDKKKSQTEPEA